jgi:hypothetical protein
MSRRVDPERIFQARRDAIRNTLTGSGMTLEAAERYCDAWEIEAARRAYLLPMPGVRETPR